MTDEAKAPAEDVNALKAKLNEYDERAKRFEALATDYEKKLSRYKGVDLDRLKADSEALAQKIRDEAAQSKDPADLKKWQEAQSAKIRSEVQRELDDLRDTNKKLAGVNHELTVVDKAMERIGGRFNDDMHPFIKGYIRQQVERDDKGELYIKGEDGEARYSPSKPANRLSLDEWAEELAQKHPSAAKATVPRGSGKGGEKINGTAGVDSLRFMSMTPEQRAKLPSKDRGALAMEALKNIPLNAK